MHQSLTDARYAFLARRTEERINAMQRVALQIIAGIDIDRVLNGARQEKESAVRRLVRLIERERQKGVIGHWSYDLNRQIALKQALDRLKAALVADEPSPA